MIFQIIIADCFTVLLFGVDLIGGINFIISFVVSAKHCQHQDSTGNTISELLFSKNQLKLLEYPRLKKNPPILATEDVLRFEVKFWRKNFGIILSPDFRVGCNVDNLFQLL